MRIKTDEAATRQGVGKELLLLVRVRNNRLRERRLTLGLSQKELCRRMCVNMNSYMCIENMYYSPQHSDGRWRKIAFDIAAFYHCDPEELFPQGVLAVKQSKVVRTLDVRELPAMIDSRHPEHLMLPEGTSVPRREIKRAQNEIAREDFFGDTMEYIPPPEKE